MSLYDILDIDENSSQEEIKKKYKELVIKYHPDKNDGNEEYFVKIKNAYETLKDPDKRGFYDKIRYFKKKQVNREDIQEIIAYISEIIELLQNITMIDIIALIIKLMIDIIKFLFM